MVANPAAGLSLLSLWSARRLWVRRPEERSVCLAQPRRLSSRVSPRENEAAANGWDHFGLEVPMINRAAVDYLLARNFRMDSFMAIFMSDLPFGRFENYILTSPPFFL